MSELKVFKFINHVDINKQESLTLCTEWTDYECQIFIFGQNKSFKGQLTRGLIEKFASNLSKSVENYIQETKRNFTSTDPNVQFYLKNEQFKWKKKLWILGDINMTPVYKIDEISEFLQRLLSTFEHFQNSITDFQSTNAKITNYQVNLENKLKELIEVKQNMETKLYKQFLLVLNSKKRKIRELESILSTKDSQNDVYDTQTDDSQDLLNSFKKRKYDCSKLPYRQVLKIATSNDDSQETCNLTAKKKEKQRVQVTIEKSIEIKQRKVDANENDNEDADSTTSTNFSTPRDEEIVNCNNIINTTNDNQDSDDEDICLKLTDESTESSLENIKSVSTNVKKRKIIESESDDDIFS